jgi:hypothetical protein
VASGNLIQQQERLTARATPRSVVYRNQHGPEVAAEEHALDYATQGSAKFLSRSLGSQIVQALVKSKALRADQLARW